MKRCGCCRLTVVTDEHELCPECDSSIEDARQNPSRRHYPQTGVVISGYSLEEIESKKVALDIIGNKVTGRDEMSKAVFDLMCGCVGIEFCYECGTTDKQKEADKVMGLSKLAHKFGLRPTSAISEDSFERDYLHDRPHIPSSYHFPNVVA